MEIAPAPSIGQRTSAADGSVHMLELSHGDDDCTGNWRLVGSVERRLIRCDRCDVELEATPENRLAAIDENYAGIYLRRLAAEGAACRGTDTD